MISEQYRGQLSLKAAKPCTKFSNRVKFYDFSATTILDLGCTAVWIRALWKETKWK